MTRSRIAVVVVGLVLAAWGYGRAVAAATGQRERIEQTVDVAVPHAPVIVDVGGTPHLVHEVHITNMRGEALSVKRLRVVARPSNVVVADLQGETLGRTLHRPGVRRREADIHTLAPAQRLVAFLWIPLTTGPKPSGVAHSLDLGLPTATDQVMTVAAGEVAISTTGAVVLGPPLAGGPWVAIYDPLLMGGHRTALYTLDGRTRIPGRFAIDWIPAPAPGAPPLREKVNPSTLNGFGSDVLAVADARVATVVDDMPDNPPDALMPSSRLPLEAGSGNFVALDIGGGRFVFYEHLRHKSIVVKAGDRVRKGQVIAQLGSSGSTSIGPHLHFHVADGNATLAAEGRPFVFERYRLRGMYPSIDALLAGEPWQPQAGAPVRERQHPPAMAVVDF